MKEENECTLISMPYASISRRESLSPSLPLGVLKAFLLNQGIKVHAVHGHLNFLYDLHEYQDWHFVKENFSIPVVHAYGLDMLFMSLIEGMNEEDESLISLLKLLYRTRLKERYFTFPSFKEKILALRQRLGGFIEKVLSQLDLERCRIFGLSCVHGQMFAAVELARRIKASCPEAVVVFGGIDCQGTTASLLLKRYPFIDCVCVDEGEIPLLNLIQARGNPQGIAGFAYRGEENKIVTIPPKKPIELDELPLPDFTDFFNEVRDEDLSEVTIPVFASRGCPWKRCSFCNVPVDQYFGYRHKSPQKFVAEILSYAQQYKECPEFILVDDDISVSESFYRILADKLENLGLLFSGHSRADRLTKPMLLSMKRAGFYGIEVGIESFSDGILERIDKGTSGAENLKALKLLRELGIESWSNIIPCYPGETRAEVEEVHEVIQEAKHLLYGSHLTLSTFALYPRCRIWKEASKWGIHGIRLEACDQLKGYDVSEGSWYTLHEFEQDKEQHRELWDNIAAQIKNFENVFHPCFYRVIGDRVVIYDFRGQGKRQVISLDQAKSMVFLACVDKLRSKAALKKILRGSKNNIDHILDGLTRQKLLHESQGQYLALPTTIYPEVKQFIAGSIEIDADLRPDPFMKLYGNGETSKTKNRALLIVDVQQAFINEFTLHLPGKIRDFIENHGQVYQAVLFTVFQNRLDSVFRTWHGYEGCMKAPDTSLAPELLPLAGEENTFPKTAFSAFRNNELIEAIKKLNIQDLDIIGLDTDACIIATAMDALHLNMKPHIIPELCASTAGIKAHRQGLEILSRHVDIELNTSPGQ